MPKRQWRRRHPRKVTAVGVRGVTGSLDENRHLRIPQAKVVQLCLLLAWSGCIGWRRRLRVLSRVCSWNGLTSGRIRTGGCLTSLHLRSRLLARRCICTGFRSHLLCPILNNSCLCSYSCSVFGDGLLRSSICRDDLLLLFRLCCRRLLFCFRFSLLIHKVCCLLLRSRLILCSLLFRGVCIIAQCSFRCFDLLRFLLLALPVVCVHVVHIDKLLCEPVTCLLHALHCSLRGIALRF
mmetsp:Transcript_23415/g.54493  ORF Transcript_23415/g.54493 Transcript_23415/m.54493 type:complete len:237 (-) Transcript_23415:1347-2057(-)